MKHIRQRLAVLTSALALSFAALAGQPVNINSANAETLSESLDGVGLNKAQAIVAYRNQHGPFQHADQLVNVKGIGIATVDRNRDFILLSTDKKVANK